MPPHGGTCLPAGAFQARACERLIRRATIGPLGMSMIACPGCRTLHTEFNAFCRVCSMALTAADAGAGPPSSRRDTGSHMPRGTLVSHYEVEELIGAGAMGQV